MRAWIMALVLVGAILAVGITILGCSGAGTTAAQVGGGPVQTLATNNLSAVVQVTGWLQILYPPATPPGGNCKAESHKVTLQDGSIHYWGIGRDCNTWDEWWHPWGAGTWTITPVKGHQIRSSWRGNKTVGGIQTVYMTQDIEGVGTLRHDEVTDWNPANYQQTMSGSATLASGTASLHFYWRRVNDTEDAVVLTLPDGMKVQFRVPLTVDAQGNNAPVMTAGLHGTVTPASGPPLDFTLTGAKGAWTKWSLRSADGTTEGNFVLGGGLSGAGELSTSGKLIGTLSWLAGGQGTLTQVSSGSVSVSPSAAARAFEINQWVSNSADLGPNPEY